MDLSTAEMPLLKVRPRLTIQITQLWLLSSMCHPLPLAPFVLYRPSKSGLQLWFDENKSDLQEENPELSEDEVFRLGMQRFKQLPKDERQVHNR